MTESSSGGVTFLGALGLLFIGLKLGGVITWSWLWVTCPLWGGLVLMLGFFVCLEVAAIVSILVKKSG